MCTGWDATMPSAGFRCPRGMWVEMHSMLLFNKFIYAYHDHTTCYVTDVDYRMIDSCTVSNRTYEQTAKYKVQQIVFPFTVRLTPWRGLRFTWSRGFSGYWSVFA